jgi:spore maturation protein CgeB
LKILSIQPGSSCSTADVYNGLVGGLEQLGHEVLNYQLDTRIARAGHWLNSCYEEAKKKNPDIVEPTTADVLFQACGDSVVKAMWKKPDWVIVVSAMYYPKLFLKMLKQAGLNVALLLTESPYDDEQQYELAACVDICWTNERTSVAKIKVCNENTHYLPHAYDPAKHRTTGNDNGVPAHDFVFVGTGFQERVNLLEHVDWQDIDVGLYGTWELVKPTSPLKKFLRSEEDIVDNTFAAALYRKAKIGLNLYRTSKGFGTGVPRISSEAESMNPRAYELAACGCFHLSDYRKEVDEVFGDSVPMFRNSSELSALIHWWVDHNEERRQIEERLPELVERHTWRNRAGQMVSDLEALQ